MNESLNKILRDTERTLEKLKKDIKHSKRKKEIDKKTELLVTVGECVQNLEKCKVNFKRNAYTQAAAVRDNMQKGADSVPQQRILWDSALGYLIADEAISALGTISGYDDLNSAYSMMENILERIGSDDNDRVPDVKKIGLGGVIEMALSDNMTTTKTPKDGFGVRHDITADLTSRDRIIRHEAMVNSFFRELIKTGELEYLVDEARKTAFHDALNKLYDSNTPKPEEIEEPAPAEIDIDDGDDDEPDIVTPVSGVRPSASSRMFSLPELDDKKKG